MQNVYINLCCQKPVQQYRTRQRDKYTGQGKRINKCVLFTVFFDGSQAVSTLPTSCMSWSWRSCDRVWCLRASCRGVSPSLSWISNLAPARTRSWKERELKIKKNLKTPRKPPNLFLLELTSENDGLGLSRRFKRATPILLQIHCWINLNFFSIPGAQLSTKAFICLKYQVYFSRRLKLACALSVTKDTISEDSFYFLRL